MKDFAGVYGGSAFNWLRMNRPVAIVLLGLASVFSIQRLSAAGDFDPVFGFYRPELFAAFDSSDLVRDLQIRQFLGGRLPGSTSLGQMGTAPVANFPTGLVSAEPRKKGNSAPERVIDPKDGKDYSSTESLAMEKASLVWTGGEVGFMYGHASGKFGGDLFSTYIVGGVGDDKMQINVGASYDEFHGRTPRWRP
jgi:hypothetical protein